MKYLKVLIDVDGKTLEIGTEFLDKHTDQFSKINKLKLRNVLFYVDKRIKEMVHVSTRSPK